MLPGQNPIAQASAKLVLKHNPGWTHADVSGDAHILRPL
jgi:hypothetical protein